MKKKIKIISRLERLRVRYLRQHILSLTSRRFRNCIHNIEYLPKKLPYSVEDVPIELELAPRRQTTLLILNEKTDPVHLCTYGSDDPTSWNGDLCDNDKKAGECPYFKPSHSIDEATEDFEARLIDDKLVYDKYRDIAALQWVLGIRGEQRPLINRFFFWFLSFFTVFSIRRNKHPLPSYEEDIPEDFWE